MCDSLCAVGPEGTLFAKSSDRPPTEPQVIEPWTDRPAGGVVRTQYLPLDDCGAAEVLGSRPTWLWGMEHGVNAHRVAIGNEQLWTVDDPSVEPEALTGMDLVRLGLERGRSAAEAIDVLVGALEEHGQGGVGDRDAGKAYFSSFLVADPTEAWVLETSARSWAARRTGPATGAPGAAVAVSNRITLSTDWDRASADVEAVGDFDRWRRTSSPTAHADKRLAVTRAAAGALASMPTSTASSDGARQLAAVLRHHGVGDWGRPGDAWMESGARRLPPAVVDRHGTGVSLCMHLTGIQATTASMIASLPLDPDEPLRTWHAPGNPCVAVFVPAFGIDGIAPELADPATWHRFEALRDRVEQARIDDADDGGASLLAEVRAALDPVEAELWADADAVAQGAPAEQRRWATALWPSVDAALRTLGV